MTPSKSPQVITILGAPGAGKGTQTMLAADTFRFSRIEAAKILEQRFNTAKPGETVEAHGKTYVLEEQQQRWRDGLLVEAPLVSKMYEEKVKELLENGESVIFDGFPRSVEQMDYLMPYLQDKVGNDRILVIYLEMKEEESVKRNSARRVCQLMRHPVLSLPETEKLSVCPLDGSKLIKRVLDDPEAIKIRLQEFRNQTFPLLEYFKEKEIEVHRINAEQSVAEVFSQVSEVIKKEIK